jgi:hypothetical protein
MGLLVEIGSAYGAASHGPLWWSGAAAAVFWRLPTPGETRLAVADRKESKEEET